MTESLLLVEPNALFRDGLALLLKWRTGLRCIQVGSLAEAQFSLESAQEYVCVLVDLDLPDGNGTELLKQPNGPPTLALIRARSIKRQAQALEAGANEVVSLTEPPERILSAVQRLIDTTGAQSRPPFL